MSMGVASLVRIIVFFGIDTAPFHPWIFHSLVFGQLGDLSALVAAQVFVLLSSRVIFCPVMDHLAELFLFHA
jgi:hypothetical protein